MEIKKIAFLDVYSYEDSAVMGVIMATDSDTKPIEFRITSPIKPTNFQKILYGNVLKEHILVELLALPLIKALNENIDIILVNNPLFLGINSKQEIQTVRIFSGNQSNGEKGSALQLKPANGTPNALYIDTSKEVENELGGIVESLGKIAKIRDLVEPFERLQLACEQVSVKRSKE